MVSTWNSRQFFQIQRRLSCVKMDHRSEFLKKIYLSILIWYSKQDVKRHLNKWMPLWKVFKKSLVRVMYWILWVGRQRRIGAVEMTLLILRHSRKFHTPTSIMIMTLSKDSGECLIVWTRRSANYTLNLFGVEVVSQSIVKPLTGSIKLR